MSDWQVMFLLLAGLCGKFGYDTWRMHDRQFHPDLLGFVLVGGWFAIGVVWSMIGGDHQ